VRVRREVMPVLRDVLGDRVDEALARTAALAREDADLLDDLVGPDCHGDELQVDELDPRPALLSRHLRAWLVQQGLRDAHLDHTRAVAALVTDWRGQGPVHLPGGLRVSRVGGVLRAVRGH